MDLRVNGGVAGRNMGRRDRRLGKGHGGEAKNGEDLSGLHFWKCVLFSLPRVGKVGCSQEAREQGRK